MLATYSSSNKPVSILKNGILSKFSYDMNDTRYKKTTFSHSGGTVETLYIDKTYEKISDGNEVNDQHRYYIYENGKAVAMYIKDNNNSFTFNDTNYLHYDSLGSVDTITDGNRNVLQRVFYKPFGEKFIIDERTDTSKELTNRGFTGQKLIKK